MWLPDQSPPKTSCQHNTFGGAPAVFDFIDLSIKQQGKRLVDAKVYAATLGGPAYQCNSEILHFSPGRVG